jgi:hypothetical protein
MLIDQSHSPRHDPSRGSQAADTEPSLVGDSGSAERWHAEAARAFQHYLDRTTPHTARRWADTLAAAVVYVLRVYVVTYRLGIYLLNLLISFLSPMVDPEVEELEARPRLPTRGSDEFKPFIYHLPVFKFWYATAFSAMTSFWTMLNPKFCRTGRADC